MASSASRGGDRAIHQDYIARIRYSNTLPPPPNPPKLLHIPDAGLASGQYTNPGFASRLAREQPLNIEADAELGMPIDLVGMPGIFDGDESSIQAPLHAPVPHPNDRALLRPLASLGKPKTSETGVSFLRRTEYISSHTGGKARFDAAGSKALKSSNSNRMKTAPTNVDVNSPEYIKSKIEKSFEKTQAKLKQKAQIRHPTKPHVKLESTLELLPDLTAFTDFGGYLTIKYLTNPVHSSKQYDTRLDAAIFLPLDTSEEATKAYEVALDLHNKDPSRYDAPVAEQNSELFLLDGANDAANYKRKVDELEPSRDDDSLYTFQNHENSDCFRFTKIRGYEMHSLIDQFATRYDDELVLAAHDGRDPKRQKAMFYYPVVQRQTIRPQRKKNMDYKRYGGLDEGKEEIGVDHIDLKVRDPTDEEKQTRSEFGENPLKSAVEEEEEEVVENDDSNAAAQLLNGATDAESHQNGTNGVDAPGSDRDASGSEE